MTSGEVVHGFSESLKNDSKIKLFSPPVVTIWGRFWGRFGAPSCRLFPRVPQNLENYASELDSARGSKTVVFMFTVLHFGESLVQNQEIRKMDGRSIPGAPQNLENYASELDSARGSKTVVFMSLVLRFGESLVQNQEIRKMDVLRGTC